MTVAGNDDKIARMLLWYEMQRLQDRYIATLDDDRLEEWPDLFADQCLYEIKPRENEIAGLPIALMRCDSKGCSKIASSPCARPIFTRHIAIAT